MTPKSLLHQLIRRLHVEADADDAVLVLAGRVFHLGRGHNSTIGQQFHAGIAAVADSLGVAVEELDVVLAGRAVIELQEFPFSPPRLPSRRNG